MFKNILMPTDGSDHSERAIMRGIELAKLCKAKVTGIHVVPEYRFLMAFAEPVFPDPTMREETERKAYACAATFLEFVTVNAKEAGVPWEIVIATNDRPYDAIVNAANVHRCDLIVLTSRYRPSLWSLIVGNEADRVLHRASIPVLTFRALMSADHPDRQRWRDPSMKRTNEGGDALGGFTDIHRQSQGNAFSAS
jgi:nucleotide-binding universal stress UspA family protein